MRTEEKKKTKRILEALVPIFVVCYFLFWFYLYIFFKKSFFLSLGGWLSVSELVGWPLIRFDGVFPFFFFFFFVLKRFFFILLPFFVLFFFFLLLTLFFFFFFFFFVRQRFFPQVPVLLPLRSNKMCSISKKEPSMPQKKKRSDSGII